MSLSPATLARVPTGATATRPYWQRLVIQLSRNVSAGNWIQVSLPAGVTVADLDGDGSVEDEISVIGTVTAATGYRSTTGSTPDKVRIMSPSGGSLGTVHVQFPIMTPSTATTAAYGAVTFGSGSERTIPAGTLRLSVVSPAALQLAQPTRLFVDGVADTTTNAQGDRYPSPAAPAFAAGLPDLARDADGASQTNALSAAVRHNGDDGDDVTYRFWWSTTDSLTAVDTTTATAAVDAADGGPATAAEGDSVRLAFDMSQLSAGVHYLYVTSDLTASWPLVRSRGVTVTHAPAVLAVAPAVSGDPDWLDSGRLLGFDDGQRGPASDARDALALTISVVDYDDTASVRLFYATSGSLDTTVVTTSGSAPSRTVTGLTGATRIDTSLVLREGLDSTLSWRVGASDSTAVTAGDYYLYAVATDGTELAIGRSDTLFHVRHSPFLGLDSRTDVTRNTGGIAPARYHTISWNQDRGIEGDFDRDDTGGTIALYYSDDDGFGIPDGADDVIAAAADTARDTHAIVTGLHVDDDGPADNQYQWDLWTYSNPDDEGVPRQGVDYTIYGVVSAGGVRRLVRWEDGAGAARSLRFVHDPHVTIEAPLAAVTVDGRRSFEVAWEAIDVDDDAALWVVLAPATEALDAHTTWDGLSATTPLWIATSGDGSLATGAPVSENTTASVPVRPARLRLDAQGAAQPIGNGDYAVYVVIDPAAGATPAADSPATRAPGTVTLDSFGAGGAEGLAAPAVEVLPARVTASSWRDTTVFTLRPNSQGETVDVVSVFLSVDTLLVDVVDQDPNRAGTQPFAVSSDLAGQTLYDSVKAGTDSTVAGLWVLDLVYFEQAGRVFDGDTELATIALRSKERQGTATLRVDNLEPRRTAFYRSGIEVGSLAPETGAVIDFRGRPTISGHLRLQGRTVHREEATFELRARNGVVALSDSLFLASNDVNATKAGLQDSLDSLGGFTFTQVPPGTWSLKAHVDRYLDGHTGEFRADPGQALTGLDPLRLASGAAGQVLPGGDVTGWSDTTGASSPDNEVDQLDVDFVASYFGVSTAPGQAAALADVDGDSLVWVPDLNMVAANFGSAGADPSYRRAASAGADVDVPARLRLEAARDARGRLVVRVTGQALPEVRAYGLTLAYAPDLWRPLDAEPRALFAGRPAVGAFRDDGTGRVHLGGALVGAGTLAAGDQTLGRVVFGPVADAAPASTAGVELVAASLIDGADRLRPGQWAQTVLPAGFALHAAYPNPFNPETALRFEAPVAASVTLAVYDLAGQRLRTLVDGPVDAGVHTAHWDGRDDEGRAVASGTYFARLRAPGVRQERKMLLLR